MIKIAVCDDEIWAVQELVSKIKYYMQQRTSECTIAKFLSGEALLLNIAATNTTFDAVFLDIKMNSLNGMDTAKAIRKIDEKALIIFVTALKEYVFDAFEVNAMNFLVKPIPEDKLSATLDRVIAAVNLTPPTALIVRRGGAMVKIPFANIVYCEILNHRIFIYEKARTHEYYSKIDDLKKALNDDFFRCHRSYIIHLKHIESYADGLIHVASGEKIPVAARRQAEFMKALLRYQRKGLR